VEQEWTIEYSEEVDGWLDSLKPKQRAVADTAIERLRMAGNNARMPLSRSLGDKLFELRFSLERTDRRITYTTDTVRRIITLTTFRKQRQNESREVSRARKALKDWFQIRKDQK
jgi:hypothetical protein